MIIRSGCSLTNVLFLVCSALTVSGTPLNGESPLFLTPYIESGRLELGRRAAYVQPLVEGVESYSGYLTVNKTCNSNLFFWYFPSEVSPESAPVVVWLQGGPGSSSMFGLFEENGPIYFDKQGSVKKRQYYWSQWLHVIYIDNPVGTGFSFTDSDECYAKDQVRVGNDLFSAVSQFLTLFPDLQANELFITGESYGGKYVPALAYRIHENNRRNLSNINLHGIAIGNALVDPENMLSYGDYFYQIGIIDFNERQVFHSYENKTAQNIKAGNFKRASQLFSELMLGNSTYFHNVTGFSFIYNFLHEKDYDPFGDSDIFVQKAAVRSAIHVGNLTFHTDDKVHAHLFADIMKSVKPWFQVLIENYRVLLYNGQLDIIIPYPLTVNFLRSLEWSGAELYREAERKEWRVGEDLAGYSKTAKGFTEVLVRNAGHMVPLDQPRWALDLITRFTLNKPF